MFQNFFSNVGRSGKTKSRLFDLPQTVFWTGKIFSKEVGGNFFLSEIFLEIFFQHGKVQEQ